MPKIPDLSTGTFSDDDLLVFEESSGGTRKGKLSALASYLGNLFVTSVDGASGAVDLSGSYVAQDDDGSIVTVTKLTQSEYDALDPPDEHTLYVVVEDS